MFATEKRVLDLSELFYETMGNERVFLSLTSEKMEKCEKKRIRIYNGITFLLPYGNAEEPKLIIAYPKKNCVKVVDIPKKGVSYTIDEALKDNDVEIYDVIPSEEEYKTIVKYYALKLSASSTMYAYESDNDNYLYSREICDLSIKDKYGVRKIEYISEKAPLACARDIFNNVYEKRCIQFSDYSVLADEIFDVDNNDILIIRTVEFSIGVRYGGLFIDKHFGDSGYRKEICFVNREYMGGMASLWIKKIMNSIEDDDIDSFISNYSGK